MYGIVAWLFVVPRRLITKVFFHGEELLEKCSVLDTCAWKAKEARALRGRARTPRRHIRIINLQLIAALYFYRTSFAFAFVLQSRWFI